MKHVTNCVRWFRQLNTVGTVLNTSFTMLISRVLLDGTTRKRNTLSWTKRNLLIPSSDAIFF